MLRSFASVLTAVWLLVSMGTPALAGACLAEDPAFTQCTEYPKGTDESMIKSQCGQFHQKYVIKCPAPKHKYCVEGERKTGRIFTWGKDVDVETCVRGTWHP